MKRTKIAMFFALTLGLLSTQCSIGQRVVVKINPRSHSAARIVMRPVYVVPRRVYVVPRPVIYIHAMQVMPLRRVYITC